MLLHARNAIKGIEMEPDQNYQVIKQQNSYLVIDASSRTVIECRDEINAHHYAVLLNKAYYRGYKAGLAAGKTHIS